MHVKLLREIETQIQHVGFASNNSLRGAWKHTLSFLPLSRNTQTTCDRNFRKAISSESASLKKSECNVVPCALLAERELQKICSMQTDNCQNFARCAPVTQRSTLVVRNRLEPTEGRCRTLSRASLGPATLLKSRGGRLSLDLTNSKRLRGILPSTFSRSRSTGGGLFGGASLSTRVMRPLPLMLPMTCKCHFFFLDLRQVTGLQVCWV